MIHNNPSKGGAHAGFALIELLVVIGILATTAMVALLGTTVKARDTKSGYRYVVASDTLKCAIYATLENEDKPVTLPQLTTPTPGGGTGVLNAGAPGPNGTSKFYQVSN